MGRIVSAVCLMLALVLPAQASEPNPQTVVKSVSDVVLSQILANQEALNKGPEFLLNLVETRMMPIIDQKRMSQLALGKYWKEINDKQRADFETGFKRLLIKTYAGAFKAYTGQDVTYGETRFNKSGSKAIVSSDIHVAGGSPISLQYRLYQPKEGQWLVYDATIAGLGLVRTYRAQFSDQIARDGIDKTIADLQSIEL